MKTRHLLGIALLAISTVICAQSMSPSTRWHWDKGTIVVDTPARPAGQQSALGLTAPKLETVRVGFAGLGSRGPWAVNRYCHIPGVHIVALCDYEEGRARDAFDSLYIGCEKFFEVSKRQSRALQVLNGITEVYYNNGWLLASGHGQST